MNRRHFVGTLAAGVCGAGALGWRLLAARDSPAGRLRPPGALPEEGFRRACVRCGACAAICPRGCIVLSELAAGPGEAGLPYVDARRRACDLCMRCGEVCPTAALAAIAADKETIATQVTMGTAVVDEGLCLSFLGRLCGICRDACPYPGRAIKLGSWARPIVVEKDCVGCGLCVEICPQQPTAIRIHPGHQRRFFETET